MHIGANGGRRVTKERATIPVALLLCLFAGLQQLDRLGQLLDLVVLFAYPIIDMTNLSASASA